MTNQDKLYEILSAEYSAFIDKLKGLPPAKIIDSSYEKVFKEDILMCFEAGDSFGEKQIVALLALEKPLDSLYKGWLDVDDSYMESLRDCISNFATKEIEFQKNDEIIKNATPHERILPQTACAEFSKEKQTPVNGKLAFEKALSRGQEKTDAYKAKVAQEPDKIKKKDKGAIE